MYHKQPPGSLKKAVLENFAVFTGNCLYWCLFQAQACNFIKKILQHRCFPVNIAKFLRSPILKNICERLRLNLLKDHRGNG